MSNLKQIIDTNSSAVEFPLLGQTYIVSSQRIVFHHLKQKYDALANTAYKKFLRFMNEFENLTDLIDSAPIALITALEDSITEVSSDAVSVGCYSMDADAVVNNCLDSGYFDPFEEAYGEYVARSNAIDSKLSNAADYRAARKANRGRWTSATFGGTMLDAWGNQLRTSAMNAVEGAGHSIRNAIGNMIDEINADEERKNLFKNTGYRNALASSVYVCAANLRLVITKDIAKSCNERLGGWVTADDSKQAESMYNNLNKLNLTKDKRMEFVKKLLELNPFNYEYYVAALKNFLENGKEILDIASFFNINNLMDDVQNIIADYARNYIVRTQNELNDCRDSVYKSAAALGIDSDKLKNALQVINERGEQILTNTANQNIGKTEDDAYNCRKNISQMREEMQLPEETAKKAYCIIDDRLAKLDLEYRTVNGIVLTSRSAADQARVDVDNYKDILDTTVDFKFKSHYLQHIQRIRELPLDRNVAEKYISQTTAKMEEFDKRCKKAARYEFRRKHGGLPFWNGDAVSMGIQYLILAFMVWWGFYAFKTNDMETVMGWMIIFLFVVVYMFCIKTKKEKKIWNELTENGKYSFDQVTSESI